MTCLLRSSHVTIKCDIKAFVVAKRKSLVLQDFVESLPFACYTNPVSGMLNLTTALPEYRCRPDLGPKSYLATGRVRERCDGTDSVTKLHLDMTDAVNILVHAQCKNKGDEAYSLLLKK